MEKLSSFTDEELQKELDKRNNKWMTVLNHQAGKDYYWMWCDFDLDEGEKPHSINVVHKRFWHLKHHINDSSPRVVLPEGFSECCESEYSFNCTLKQVPKLMKSFGYTELQNPDFNSDLYLTPSINGTNYQITMCCDEQQIKDYLKSKATKKKFKTVEDFQTYLYDIAEGYGCHLTVGAASTYGSGSCLFKTVYDSLPLQHVNENYYF